MMDDLERERRLREKALRKPVNDTTLTVQDLHVDISHLLTMRINTRIRELLNATKEASNG